MRSDNLFLLQIIWPKQSFSENLIKKSFYKYIRKTIDIPKSNLRKFINFNPKVFSKKNIKS